MKARSKMSSWIARVLVFFNAYLLCVSSLLAQNLVYESRIASFPSNTNFGSKLLCLEPHLLAIADNEGEFGDGQVRLFDVSTGSFTTLYQSPAHSASPPNLAFGSSLLGFQVNTDASQELAVGSPGEGKVYILPNTSTTFPVEFVGSPNDEFGVSLASLDWQSFGSDTFPVIAVGAPNRGNGEVDIFRADLPFPSPLFNIGPSGPAFAGARFGESLSSIPDIDGDAVPDLAVGAPMKQNLTGAVTGSISIYRGDISSLGVQFSEHPGPLPGFRFGASVLGIPDIDGDGRGELVIGAPAVSPADSGFIEVFSGADLLSSPFSPLCRFTPLESSDPSYGSDLALLGDSDGNGKLEIMVSSPSYEETAYPGFARGRVSVLEVDEFGCRPVGHIPVPLEYSGTNAEFGKSLVQGSCDFTGDGLPDFALSTQDTGGAGQGSVLLYSGVNPKLVPTSSTFRFRIGGAGSLRGNNEYDIAPNMASQCNITLYAKMSIGDEIRTLQEIVSVPISQTEFRFAAESLPKVSKVGGVRPIIHMATSTNCLDTSLTDFRSNIASRYMSCGIGDFGVTVAEWMRMFRDSFSSNPERRFRNEKRKRRAIREYRKKRKDYTQTH
jgi:hypothetical protein